MLNSSICLFFFLAVQGPLPTPLDFELAGKALEWFRQGEAMIGTESEYSEAQAHCFREALALDPDFEQARNNLILVLLAQENFKEAEEQASQLISWGSGSAQGYLYRAEARLRMSRPEEALEDLSIFLEENPGDTRGLELKSKAHFIQGDYSEAEAVYKRVEKPSDDSLGSRISIGLSLLNSGKNQAAFEVFSELVEAFPKAWESHYWFGAALRDLGRLDEAVAALQIAECLDPGNERVRKELTETYLGLGDLKNAGTWINRKKNKTASDYLNLALLARAEMNLAEALSCLENAAELSPRDTSILADLAEAQVEAGRTGEAGTTFRRILQINPSDFAAHFRLAVLLAEEGDGEAAMRHLDAAVSGDPETFVPLLVKELKNVQSPLGVIGDTSRFSELIGMYKDFRAEEEPDQSAIQ